MTSLLSPMAILGLCLAMGLCLPWHGAEARGASPAIWVQDGQAKATIILPDNAQPIAQYAAQELQHHVKLATGATLDIVAESQAGDAASPRIYVGSTQAAARQGIDHDKLAPEQTILRRIGDDLYIVGKDGPGNALSFANVHAGTLWGVYEVLERELHARWLWPGEGGIVVKTRPTLAAGPYDQDITPSLMLRMVRTYVPWKADNTPLIFASIKSGYDTGLAYSSDEAINRYLVDQQVFLRRHRMGSSQQPNYSVGHNFHNWWKEYGHTHPEWFQLLPVAEGEFAGKPMQELARMGYGRPEASMKTQRGPTNPKAPGLVSMCVSNRELHKEIIRRWKEQRDKNPDKDIPVMVGENDIWALCICDECVKLDAPPKTAQQIADGPGGVHFQNTPFDAGRRYAWFYKEIHKLAMEVDPDAKVCGYVYLNYFIAPNDITLHPNIILTFVPWGGWYYPRDPRGQIWLEDQWKQWASLGARLLYRPNHILGGGSMPHNYFTQLTDQFDFFNRHGNIGTDFDARVGQWSTQGASMYALLRKHTQIDLSAGQILQDYYEAFGPAAFHVKAYFDFWEAHTTYTRAIDPGAMARNQSNHLLTYARSIHALYSQADFETAQKILDQGKAAIEGTSAASLGDEDVGDQTEKKATQGMDRSRRQAYLDRLTYIELGLEHARKVWAVSKVFADKDSTLPQQQKALRDLATFRFQTEHLHVANYAASAADELRSFRNRYDFNTKINIDYRPADESGQ